MMAAKEAHFDTHRIYALVGAGSAPARAGGISTIAMGQHHCHGAAPLPWGSIAMGGTALAGPLTLHITSQRSASQLITSQRSASRLITSLYHIAAYHIAAYHIAAYRIAAYHIAAYRIIVSHRANRNPTLSHGPPITRSLPCP